MSGQQERAEATVESFRQDLGPFVVAAETTRMPMIFTNAQAPDHPIIFANAAFLGLTGYGREELLGKEFRSLLANGDRDAAKATADDAFREDEGTEGDLQYRRKDGTEFWASTFVSPVRDESGAVVQHFSSLIDLTERMRNNARREIVDELTEDLNSAQRDLHEADAELADSVERRAEERRSSDRFMRSVLDAFPDGVILLEVRGDEHRFAYVNVAAEKFLCHRREDVIGKRDADILDPSYRQENRQVVASSMPCFIRDRLLETKDGVRAVEVRKLPFDTTSNGSNCLLVIIRDVTEMRELEDTLRQAQRIDALGQLTGGIAHDFNNMLAVALGNLELLDSDGVSQEEGRELLEDARNACLRGAELTGRLLAFARRQTLEPVPTNINARLSETTKLLSRLLGADIDLRLNLAENQWDAVVDPAQLETALINLLTNARDAMPDGGRLTISTRNEVLDSSTIHKQPGLKAGEYVAIEVADNGTGMTAEIQRRSFDPFFTTKAEGHGTGLGLSMVFGFAKQSGGHVHIDSQPGEGTRVVLLLPRAGSTAVEDAVKDADMPEHAAGERVLVVDDNDSLRRVTSKQLSSLGYDVLEAADGPSALRLLEEDVAVDLLLTDIFMPGGLSGVELGREARQLRPQLKLIYMSGFVGTASGGGAALDPNVTLLRKPFRKTELAKNIREVLDSGKG